MLLVKKFLFLALGFGLSVGSLRADTAATSAELYNKGNEAFKAQDYATASQLFDQILKTDPDPTASYLDPVKLRSGLCYYYLGKYPEAIKALADLTNDKAAPANRPTALFYTGIAQFNQAIKIDPSHPDDRKAGLTAAITTLSTLITAFPKSELIEDVLSIRARAYIQIPDYPNAEADLGQLISQFSSSLELPDYQLLLGKVYGAQTSNAISAGKPRDEINALAQKAQEIYSKMARNPNAVVVGNEANTDLGEVLFLLAGLDLPKTDGYAKALAAFRQVKPKAELIPLQNNLIQTMQAQIILARQQGQDATAEALIPLRDREQQRLEDLKTGPDPIIQALLRVAACYSQMKQADEARTVLHRLQKATVTDEQKQQIDFQILFSYVVGGQTEKADKALTDYLAKYPTDTQADSISVSIASTLLQRNDNQGALAEAQRSLKDFPNGAHEAEAKVLEAQAYSALGENDKATQILKDLNADPKGVKVAIDATLTLAQSQINQKDFDGAATSYQQVINNPQAEPSQVSNGLLGYIGVLQNQNKFDDVIKQSQLFQQKFPNDPNVTAAIVQEALAMDNKNDPGTIPLLQQLVQKYPKDQYAPYALFYIGQIYNKQNDLDDLAKTATTLEQSYPDALNYIAATAQALGAAYEKLKKYDLAVAQYQTVANLQNADLAAPAQNSVGAAWLAAARAMGPYQSLQQQADKDEANKRIDAAEKGYLQTLNNFPTQLSAVGNALEGLTDTVLQRKTWGLITTDDDAAKYFDKLKGQVSMPELQARLELAKIALIFRQKNAEAQYPAAAEAYKKVIADNPSLVLTRQETVQFGKLLIYGKDYQRALDEFNALLSQAKSDDILTQADAYYGLGATYLEQGDLDQAKTNFTKLKALQPDMSWYPDNLNVDYGLGLAAEKGGDSATAKTKYAAIMRNKGGSIEVKAKSILGYGRILEQEGHGLPTAGQQDIEYAVHYYQQVDAFYDGGVPALSAEGLYDAGQVYEKANDKTNAKAQYQNLITTYGAKAPDWAAKAQDRLKQLGP